jgi:hypothetical protein
MAGRSTRSAGVSSIAKSALPYEPEGKRTPWRLEARPSSTAIRKIVQAGAHKYYLLAESKVPNTKGFAIEVDLKGNSSSVG